MTGSERWKGRLMVVLMSVLNVALGFVIFFLSILGGLLVAEVRFSREPLLFACFLAILSGWITIPVSLVCAMRRLWHGRVREALSISFLPWPGVVAALVFFVLFSGILFPR